jgi:ATP-dependent helicase/DNAse subunit B
MASRVGLETGGSSSHALAVTSLERFAQCPFKGYAHVVLAARKDEEQHELPDAREEGNLGHTALAAAFTATKEAWQRRPRDRAFILERGLGAADASMAASAGHAPLRAVVRLRVRESVRAVLLHTLEDDAWDFAVAEQAFGQGGPWPAFRVGAEHDAALWLRGSIDRIDRAHAGGGARVVDNKRSKSTVRSSSAGLGETALQVPVYAAVAARNLRLETSGAYLPIQPRDLAIESRTRSAPEERVRELALGAAEGASAIERRALQIIGAARRGSFAPLPASDAECTRCEYSGGCRKPRFAMAPADEFDDREMP